MLEMNALKIALSDIYYRRQGGPAKGKGIIGFEVTWAK